MAATPQNVEMEAAKFLHKLIQESTDEPTKLATKLHVILQHMKSSGKENSMPYQVISRAMETVINRHGLDIEALMSSRQPLTGGTQAGDSSLTQIAGPSPQTVVENDSKRTLTTEDAAKIAAFSGKPLHGHSSAGHDIYQGSASQLNSIKSHGGNAGVSGSYEPTEPANPISMQFSNSYDNQNAMALMHKDRRIETFSSPTLSDLTSGKGPAGKALEHEGGFPNVMANVSKTVQGGISNNVTELAILRNEASRDTGKLPVFHAPSVGPCTPFKEHHLKQLRAQCLVFLAFRNNLMPKKLHLEIALGNFFPKEDISGKEHIDQKGKEQSSGQGINHEVGMPSARVDTGRETERTGPGSSSSGFISETNLLKETEKFDRMVDKNDPPSGLAEHVEGMRNNMIPRKFEVEMQTFEAKESQMFATKVGQPDPTSIAVNAGLRAVPVIEGKDNISSQLKSLADSQGNRHGHSHLPSFPLRESWKSHPGMEGERHMVVPKSANVLEKHVMLGNNHEGEDTSEPSLSPPSPKYTTSEKWIADCQKRKVASEHNWAVKKKKMEQRISACAEKLKETVSSSEDISAKTKSVIELKKLELLDLQRRLRNEILHDFFKPISTEMERLKSIKKHRIGRRSKQLERYEQKMKEERQKRIRERQKDFFSEMELHKERLEDVFKFRRERVKGFNKYVREFHKRKERLYREKIDRIQREKINLLKINDVEGYLRMVQDAKSDRVKQLLKETEKYLQKLGSKLKEAKVISRCFETDMDDGRIPGLNDNSEFTFENEDETDQAKHYMESNEKYYMMAHSIKETVSEQPACLVGGKLREYQMNGLRWLLSLYNNHLNGILADEMGLGKTVQVISLLCYLMENKNDRGPFLVVVPSSVLPGWESEISFWAPSINKIVYSGPPEERRRLFKERIVQQKFNVLLTTYEYLMNKHDRPKLSKIHWHYVIIDEGHRIKNASCKLNADLKHYHSSHRLLLTGTPLQNNLEELWALLNFLLPNIFNSSEDFSQWFNKPFESNADNSLEEALLSEEENLLIINRLHQVLRPFVLRRLKQKVENELPEKIERLVRCEASAYQKLLMRRVDDNLGAFGVSKARAVHNSVVELRNICNHPYLSQLHTEEVHDFIPKHYLPNMIRFCGKLEMLDRLLPKLKATDHRVLLFSTMTRLLDVMEDYLYWKQYRYLRLDGHTCGGDRGALIDEFNKPGSPFFIFLLSIRAGGVGVNLQAADTVIIFDTDWNPQVDLQAQARAHRIGQKKDVLVLRLETVETVEEQVRASAEHKLGVANQSITAGFFDNNTSAEDRREYLESLLRECKKEEAALVLNDDALNDLIARSESEIDIFEELDKKRQEEELGLWKNLVLEHGGISGELIPPLPSRLVTDDDLKSFCEAMKAIEVPKPVVLSGVGGKRKRELGNFDTQQYGRGKRAREVRSYEEQWTEDEFERLCQVDAPDSPNPKEELKEKDLAIVTSESGMVIGAEGAGLPHLQQIRSSEELTIQQIKEINPPSKRGRGRPKKKTTYISSSPMVLPVPSVSVPSSAISVTGTVHPLGIQIAHDTQVTTTLPSGSKSVPTDGGLSKVALASASASDATLTVPPGFQPTANHPPGFQPTTSPPPGYRPLTTPPVGHQTMTTPPGYQQIAAPPPGFQPQITSPAPLAGLQVTTTLISGPELPTTLTPVSQSTPTLPAGPQSTTDMNSGSLVSASQSNTALHASSIPNSNLSPGTQPSPNLPVGSVSLPMLPPSSPDSQSAVSPSAVTHGRGRGRGRGRPRGRGRGRGQIIESEVDVPQRRGRKPNNVVLAIPGLRTSSPTGKPATALPVVPATSYEADPEPLVSGSAAVNVVNKTPAPGTVSTLLIVPPSETPKSDVASPRTSVPASPSLATSSVLTGIGETLLDPDVRTTQKMPLSVGSQSTELGTLSSQPAFPLVTVPLGSHSASPTNSVLKQGRGRGRKAQSGAETTRRGERKKEDMVNDREQKSHEPAEKKSRVSSGRKTVATRSMLRNEAQKSPNDASAADDHFSQGSKSAEQSQNSSPKEKEQSSTFVKLDILTKCSDTSTVDNNIIDYGEKVVEQKDISVATEAGSMTHEAIEKTEAKDELHPEKLTKLEGERESKPETLEGRESKPSEEVEKLFHGEDNVSQEAEVSKAETEQEKRETECIALEDVGEENKIQVAAEDEPTVQKKTEERDPTINDGGTLEVMETNPAEQIDVASHGASEVLQGGCVTVANKENLIEIAQKALMIPVQQGETERHGTSSGDSPLEAEDASPKKFEDITLGGIEHQEKEQEANDSIREDVVDAVKTSSELATAQVKGESDGLVTIEGSILVRRGARSSDGVMDAIQGEADKGLLKSSGVLSDTGKNVFEDEKTLSDPPLEKGERKDLDMDGGTLVMTEDKLPEKVEDKSSEKVDDTLKEETEHEKLGGGGGILENVINDVKTTPKPLVGLGEMEGIEMNDGGSLVSTYVEPSEKVEGASQVENGQEKQEMGGSDASVGVTENVTEDGQTTMVLHVMLGKRENQSTIDGHPLVEMDAKSAEDTENVLHRETVLHKSELGSEDGTGGIEKDVADDEQSMKCLPTAQEEREVLGTIDGVTLIETEAKPSEKDNDDFQGETVIEAEQKTDAIPLGQYVQDERDNLDINTENPDEAEAKPFERVSEAVQVETQCEKQEQEGGGASNVTEEEFHAGQGEEKSPDTVDGESLDDTLAKSSHDVESLDSMQAKSCHEVESLDDTQAKSSHDVESLDGMQAKSSHEVESLDDAQAKSSHDVESLDGMQAKSSHEVESLHDAQAKSSHDVESLDGMQAKSCHEVESLDDTQAKSSHDVESLDSIQAKSCHEVESLDDTQAKSSHDVESLDSMQAKSCHEVESRDDTQAKSFHDVESPDDKQAKSSHDVESPDDTQAKSCHEVESPDDMQAKSSHDVESLESLQAKSCHEVESPDDTQAKSSHDVESQKSAQAKSSNEVDNLFEGKGEHDETDHEPPVEIREMTKELNVAEVRNQAEEEASNSSLNEGSNQGILTDDGKVEIINCHVANAEQTAEHKVETLPSTESADDSTVEECQNDVTPVTVEEQNLVAGSSIREGDAKPSSNVDEDKGETPGRTEANDSKIKECANDAVAPVAGDVEDVAAKSSSGEADATHSSDVEGHKHEKLERTEADDSTKECRNEEQVGTADSSMEEREDKPCKTGADDSTVKEQAAGEEQDVGAGISSGGRYGSSSSNDEVPDQ